MGDLAPSECRAAHEKAQGGQAQAASECRERLEEVEPWLLDIAQELTGVVKKANYFGAAEWTGAGCVARVERTASGIRVSFWQVEE